MADRRRTQITIDNTKIDMGSVLHRLLSLLDNYDELHLSNRALAGRLGVDPSLSLRTVQSAVRQGLVIDAREESRERGLSLTSWGRRVIACGKCGKTPARYLADGEPACHDHADRVRML